MKSTLYHRTMHLREDQLMPQDGGCPFCASASREEMAVLQRAPLVCLLSCKNCWAVSASRMPTAEVLKAYYGSYYSGREMKVTMDLPDRLAARIFSVIKSHYRKGVINILDFGGGGGEIAASLAERLISAGADEVRACVVDYYKGPLPAASAGVKMTRCEELSLVQSQTFDIVIASAVIEHIPYPMPVMNNLFSLLATNGIFYARTPFITPIMKIFERVGLTFDFTYPGHLHDLGSQFWGNIFDTLPVTGAYEYMKSGPSPVETSFRENFIRTLLSGLFKAPWYLSKGSYSLVGGWEIFIRKK